MNTAMTIRVSKYICKIIKIIIEGGKYEIYRFEKRYCYNAD